MSWDASDGATGYKIYHSSDMGTTWDAGTDVGNVTTCVMPNVPDSGLQLYRASAYNANGEATRLNAGVWYWGDAPGPPPQPTGIGIK